MKDIVALTRSIRVGHFCLELRLDARGIFTTRWDPSARPLRISASELDEICIVRNRMIAGLRETLNKNEGPPNQRRRTRAKPRQSMHCYQMAFERKCHHHRASNAPQCLK
jgi:hypothetical protein